MGGEGSNGFAAWKSFISLPIASPGPGWEEDSIVVNHPLLPYWVSFSKSNVCAVFVCVCVCVYLWLQQRAWPAGFRQHSWSWGELLAGSGAHWNSSHESAWTPPSFFVSPRASTAASALGLEVSQQSGGAGELHFVIFGVDLSAGRVGGASWSWVGAARPGANLTPLAPSRPWSSTRFSHCAKAPHSQSTDTSIPV